MKKYFLFFVLTIGMILVPLSCYAEELLNENVDAIINKEISIIYNNELKTFFDVNGKSVSPISYNNTTYLPIRSISALFSIPVEWDGANNKVLLGKGDIVEKLLLGKAEGEALGVEHKESILCLLFGDAA